MTDKQIIARLRSRIRKLRSALIRLNRWQLNQEYERKALAKITSAALAEDERHK